ncbi:hypothetical protein [Persicimonas caeni]|nr:hypothetical protein [Persicimonas caeni]
MRLATGGGVMLFDAFSFSLAVTLGDEHGGEFYLLPGLSIPDLAQIGTAE